MSREIIQKRMILCLGPHRSGTSLVTAGLHALGANLGLTDNPESIENQKGFFEHPDVLAFNEGVLDRLNTSWDDFAFDGGGALAAAGLDDNRLEDLIGAGADLVQEICRGHSVTAIKDPRLSLLLPLWFAILDRANFRRDTIALVYVLRHPAEAAKSQLIRQRDNPSYYEIGRDLREGAALWLSYTAQAFRYAGNNVPIVVPHADMLSEPKQTLEALATCLGLDCSAGRVSEFAEVFVDESLYRSKVHPDEEAHLAATFPDLERVVSRLQTRSLLSPSDCQPDKHLSKLLGSDRTQATVARIAAGTVGRLSTRWRSAAQEAKRNAAERGVAEDRADVLQRRVADADATVTSLTERYAELTAERGRTIKAFELEVVQLRQGLAAAQAARDALLTERERLHQEFEAEYANLRAGLTAAEAARDTVLSARGELQRALEAETASLREDLRGVESARKDLLAELDQLGRARELEVGNLTASLNEARAACDASHQQLAEVRHALQAENSRLRDALSSADMERDNLSTRQEELQAALADLTAALDDARAARDDEIGAREAMRLAHDRKLQSVRADLKRARVEARKSGGEVMRLTSAVADAFTERDRLRAECESLKTVVRSSETERDSVLAQKDAIAGALRETLASLSARENERKDLQQEVDDLLRTRSWRCTAPLRAAGMVVRRGAGALRTRWGKLNATARTGYRATMARSPGAANAARFVLWPVLTFGNRVLLGKDSIPLATPVDDRSGNLMFQFDNQRPLPVRDYAPLVTVIVPNFNHARFLRQRLDSIYRQSYPNLEVILMDDCSSDNSREILQEYALANPRNTRVLFNEENSGSVFRQWEKGLLEARGDLIWIAESDDWASENLLETLVPFFANPCVQLAYTRTEFMSEDGQEKIWSMDDYLADLGRERWHRAWVEPAPAVVRNGFANKNIIPNVSSAVFRRISRLDVLENHLWRDMCTCGDWVFYLNLIRGGAIAYSPDARNYFRQHGANTSVGSFKGDRYYKEHETVARTVLRHYRVDPAVFCRQRDELAHHWRRNRESFSSAEFASCYDLSRIIGEARNRKPAILMAGYGFCAGGGETFPIQLANLMKTAGYSVTYLDCGQEPEVPGIRAMLETDMAVVSNLADLKRIAADFDIDIIHSHHAWVDNSILDILPEDSPVRTVVTLHGMYDTIRPADLQRILPRLVRRTGKLVYTAEKNLGALVAQNLVQPGEVARIDNALARGDVRLWNRASLGISDEAFVLTLVSRALEDKGWSEAVDAVGKARQQTGRDIHLILIGEGTVYERMKKHGTPEYVHLEGFRSSIRDYFAASDLGFLPSRYRGESFPLVIIECLNAGRPVLASAIGEIEYMLATDDGPAGSLFELNPDWTISIDALANEIARLATDPSALALLAGRVSLAARRFDPELMRDRYDGVYVGLMGSTHGADEGHSYAA